MKKRLRDYYKIQYFDKNTLAWVDIQKSYLTLIEAQENIPNNKTVRLMHITPNKRVPLNA